MHNDPPTFVATPSGAVDPRDRGGPGVALHDRGRRREVDLLVVERGATGREEAVLHHQARDLPGDERPAVERAPAAAPRRQQTGEVGVAPERHDGHAVVALARQQPAVERDRARDLGAVVDRVGQAGDHRVGVAVLERVGVTPGDGAERQVGVAVPGVDGVEGGDRDPIGHVGHDPEQPYLALLVEHVRHADGGGVVPPSRQVGVDDDARRARALARRADVSRGRRARATDRPDTRRDDHQRDESDRQVSRRARPATAMRHPATVTRRRGRRGPDQRGRRAARRCTAAGRGSSTTTSS